MSRIYLKRRLIYLTSTHNGGLCEIIDIGNQFISDKLGAEKYPYDVFDIIVDHLRSSPMHKATKGTSRGKSDKVGYGQCKSGTVIYNFATKYYGKKLGDSTFDPIFVLGAVLEWAGIVHNRRGYLELV